MKIITKRVKSRFRQCLPPYSVFRSCGPNLEKNRLHIYLNSTETCVHILYSRYLWEVSHGRKVRKGYEIDHIDGDCTNDTLDNLQEISHEENIKKGTSEILKRNGKNSRRLFLWCPVCHKRFKVLKWKVNLKKLKKGKEFHFCCRSCQVKAQHIDYSSFEKQKYKKIKLKEFTPANVAEPFKKFSKPIFIDKKIRICDCGNKLPTEYSSYCCKECRIKYGDTSNCFKVNKEKLIKYCKISMKKFGRYHYSWIGIKLGVSDKAVKKNIIKYKIFN